MLCFYQTFESQLTVKKVLRLFDISGLGLGLVCKPEWTLQLLSIPCCHTTIAEVYSFYMDVSYFVLN